MVATYVLSFFLLFVNSADANISCNKTTKNHYDVFRCAEALNALPEQAFGGVAPGVRRFDIQCSDSMTPMSGRVFKSEIKGVGRTRYVLPLIRSQQSGGGYHMFRFVFDNDGCVTTHRSIYLDKTNATGPVEIPFDRYTCFSRDGEVSHTHYPSLPIHRYDTAIGEAVNVQSSRIAVSNTRPQQTRYLSGDKSVSFTIVSPYLFGDLQRSFDRLQVSVNDVKNSSFWSQPANAQSLRQAVEACQLNQWLSLRVNRADYPGLSAHLSSVNQLSQMISNWPLHPNPATPAATQKAPASAIHSN